MNRIIIELYKKVDDKYPTYRFTRTYPRCSNNRAHDFANKWGQGRGKELFDSPSWYVKTKTMLTRVNS